MQGEIQPGDRVSKSTRSRHRKRDNEQLTTVQVSTQLYFFLVLHGDERILLCPSGVVASSLRRTRQQLPDLALSRHIFERNSWVKFGYPTVGENVDFD
jgi:hypothetical protein